jgi:hypothetical protein
MDGLGIEEVEADEDEDEVEEEKVRAGTREAVVFMCGQRKGDGAREREGEKGQTSPRNCSVMGVGRGGGRDIGGMRGRQTGRPNKLPKLNNNQTAKTNKPTKGLK